MSDTLNPQPSTLNRVTKEGLTLFKRYPGPHAKWYHKFNCDGRQHMIKLSANLAESVALAKKIRARIQSHRLELVHAALDCAKSRHAASTLGELFRRYQDRAPAATGVSAATVAATLQCVRVIVRCGRADGVDADSLASTSFSAAQCEAYKHAMLKRAGEDRLAQDRAYVTANSTLRQARSLFSAKLPLDFYSGLVLPDVATLKTVRLFQETKTAFKMPAPELVQKIRDALPELKKTDPNAYLIYLLALPAGLRAGEIAAARQTWIEEINGATILRIQTEKDFRPKTKQERPIPLDPSVLKELRELMELTVGIERPYILRGAKHERTDAAFRRFGAWLKSLGWTRRKKAHELRKMFGSYVAQQAGIRAAQEVLGHSSVRTTEEHYVGQVSLPQYTIPALGA